jgi:hypothetical protein
MIDKANTDTKERYKSRLALGICLKPRTKAIRGSCYDSRTARLSPARAGGKTAEVSDNGKDPKSALKGDLQLRTLELSENLFVRWFEHRHAFTQASIKNTSFMLLLYK